MGGRRRPAPQSQFNSREPLRMPNTVFGETLGNDIPQDHGLQAQKYLLTHNPHVSLNLKLCFEFEHTEINSMDSNDVPRICSKS